MAFVQLNAYLGNARKHWRGLVIGMQTWVMMYQRAAAVANTIQASARTAFFEKSSECPLTNTDKRDIIEPSI